MTLHVPVWVQPVSGDPNFPQGIPVSAQELRRNTQALLAVASPAVQSGVVAALDGAFAVTQHAGGANFSVDVAAGHAFVPGTDIANQGPYGCWNDGVVNVPTPVAPPSGTRVHRLVLQIEDRYSNAVWTGYTANPNLVADTGSGTPPAPASSITLALISIAAGQASVLNANITDQRPMLGGEPGWNRLPLINSFTLTSAGVGHYQRTSGNKVHVVAALNVGTTGQMTSALPSAYWPKRQISVPMSVTVGNTSGGTPFVNIDTGGVFTTHGLTPSTGVLSIDASYPLDALP